MRIMVTDCDHANMIQEDEVMVKNGLTYEMKQCITEEDLIRECKGGEVFINQYAPFTRKVLEALRPEIKQIVRYGVGVNNVDLDAATELGVQVCNVPDYGMNEVADQAVALMMALTRKIVTVNNYTKSTDWDYKIAIPIRRIPGQTVGVIGLGRIGKTFAKRMAGFGMKIIGCDICYNVGDVVEGAEIVDLETLIKESDIISIHTPFNPSTKDMFNLDTFKAMKDTAYLINVSRGGIVNEDDLLVALKEKMIAGCALDVVLKEPMSTDCELFKFENFLCTPHIAWYSEEAALELKRKVAEEAARFALGQELHYPVNEL